jgi:hypothetical protein
MLKLITEVLLLLFFIEEKRRSNQEEKNILFPAGLSRAYALA